MEHNTKKHIEIKFDGSKLRDIMYKHDLTPMTFSKKIGLSQPAISHWLCGRNRPSRKALDKLNDYFHVTDEYWKKGVTGAFTPTVAAREEAKEAFDKSINPHEADKARVKENLEKLNGKPKVIETIEDAITFVNIGQEKRDLEKKIKEKETEIQGLKCELEGLKVENARLQGNIEGLTQQLLLKNDGAKEAAKESIWKRLFA